MYHHAECWQKAERNNGKIVSKRDDSDGDGDVWDDFRAHSFTNADPALDYSPGISYDGTGNDGPDPDTCGAVVSGDTGCQQQCVFGIGTTSGGSRPDSVQSNYEDFNRTFGCKISCPCPKNCSDKIGKDKASTAAKVGSGGLYDNEPKYKHFWDSCGQTIGSTKRDTPWGYKRFWEPRREYALQQCFSYASLSGDIFCPGLGGTCQFNTNTSITKDQCEAYIKGSRASTPNTDTPPDQYNNSEPPPIDFKQFWPKLKSDGTIAQAKVAKHQCRINISCSKNIGDDPDSAKGDFEQYWTYEAPNRQVAVDQCKNDENNEASVCEDKIKKDKESTAIQYQKYWEVTRQDRSEVLTVCREDSERVVKLCETATSKCASNCTECSRANCVRKDECGPEQNDPNCRDSCDDSKNPNCYTPESEDNNVADSALKDGENDVPNEPDGCDHTVPSACGGDNDGDGIVTTSLGDSSVDEEMANGPRPRACVYDSECLSYCSDIDKNLQHCNTKRYCMNPPHHCYGPGVCAPKEPADGGDEQAGNGPCPSQGINILERLFSAGVGYLVGMPIPKLIQILSGGSMIPIPSKPDMSADIPKSSSSPASFNLNAKCPPKSKTGDTSNSKEATAGIGVDKFISSGLKKLAGVGKSVSDWAVEKSPKKYKKKMAVKSCQMQAKGMNKAASKLSQKAGSLGISNISSALEGNLGGKLRGALSNSNTIKKLKGKVMSKVGGFGDLAGGALEDLGGSLMSGSSNPIKSIITGAGFDVNFIFDLKLEFIGIKSLKLGIQADFFFGMIFELNFRKTADWKESVRPSPTTLFTFYIYGYPIHFKMQLHARAELHAFIEASIAVGAAYYTVPESLDHPGPPDGSDNTSDDDEYPGLTKAGTLPSQNFLDNWYGPGGYNKDWFHEKNRFTGNGKFGGDNKKTKGMYEAGAGSGEYRYQGYNDWGIDLIWTYDGSDSNKIAEMNTGFSKMLRTKFDMEADFQAEAGLQLGIYDGGTGSRLLFFEPANLFLHAYAAILSPYCNAGLGLFYRMFIGFGPLKLRGKKLVEQIRIPLLSIPILQKDWMFPPSDWQINNLCAKEPVVTAGQTASNQFKVGNADFCGESKVSYLNSSKERIETSVSPSCNSATPQCCPRMNRCRADEQDDACAFDGSTEDDIEQKWANGLNGSGKPSKSTLKWVCTLAHVIGCVSKPPTYERPQASTQDAAPTSENDCSAKQKKRPKGYVRMTPAKPGEVGYMWYDKKVPVANGFNTTFSYKMSELKPNKNGGANGLAFVIQNASGGSESVSPDGGGLGYDGIEKSVAVELDTFHNTGGSSGSSIESNGNHVAIMSAGTSDNTSDHTDSSLVVEKSDDPDFQLNDGEVHSVNVSYDGTTLNVSIDGQDIVSESLDLSNLLGLSTGDKAFVGFTSATRKKVVAENHDIKSWNFAAGNNQGFTYENFSNTEGLSLLKSAANTPLRMFNNWCVPQPRDGLRISLSWNRRADLDLVLQSPNGSPKRVVHSTGDAKPYEMCSNTSDPPETVTGSSRGAGVPKSACGCDVNGDGKFDKDGPDVAVGEKVQQDDGSFRVCAPEASGGHAPAGGFKAWDAIGGLGDVIVRDESPGDKNLPKKKQSPVERAWASVFPVGETAKNTQGTQQVSGCVAKTCTGDKGTGGWKPGHENKDSGMCAPPHNTYQFVESVSIPNPLENSKKDKNSQGQGNGNQGNGNNKEAEDNGYTFWVVNNTTEDKPAKSEGHTEKETESIQYEIEVEMAGSPVQRYRGSIPTARGPQDEPKMRYEYKPRPAIAGTTGGVKVVSPLPDVRPNMHESNNTIFVFPEKLKEPVSVDVDSRITSNTTFPDSFAGHIPGGSIDQKANVFFAHYDDKVGSNKLAGGTGKIIFENEILGIDVSGPGKLTKNHCNIAGCSNSSDCLYYGGEQTCEGISPSTKYSLEDDASECECKAGTNVSPVNGIPADHVQILGPKTVKIHLRTGGSADNLRIYTAAK